MYSEVGPGLRRACAAVHARRFARMRPARSVAALIAAAALAGGCAAPAGSATCPADLPEMVGLHTLDPAPAIEVRYATEENFTGAPLPGYEEPVALLRPDAAAALQRVAARLAADGLGLKVWDAYRPRRASVAMVDWARRSGNLWVIEEGYVAPESGHNLGATIDLTLVTLEDGRELEMGTDYDDFVEAAHTANASGAVRENRRRLVSAMRAEGWENYPLEWWHFSFPTRAPPLDVPLGCYR